mmetsp:Transcript_129048/g.373409  ORF Transcript_129048/g.373409 Transcript_129048/m.373409 type:complete len:269 (+) Transcript_129048:1498-2304(+)
MPLSPQAGTAILPGRLEQLLHHRLHHVLLEPLLLAAPMGQRRPEPRLHTVADLLDVQTAAELRLGAQQAVDRHLLRLQPLSQDADGPAQLPELVARSGVLAFRLDRPQTRPRCRLRSIGLSALAVAGLYPPGADRLRGKLRRERLAHAKRRRRVVFQSAVGRGAQDAQLVASADRREAAADTADAHHDAAAIGRREAGASDGREAHDLDAWLMRVRRPNELRGPRAAQGRHAATGVLQLRAHRLHLHHPCCAMVHRSLRAAGKAQGGA